MSEINTTSHTLNEVRMFSDDDRGDGIPVTVASTQAAMTVGTPLGRVTATGKYVKYDPLSVLGPEFCSGLLADQSVDAVTEGRDVLATMWTCGSYDYTKLYALGLDDSGVADMGGRVVPGRNLIILPGGC